MDTRHYRFTVGDFECLAISDGALVGGPSYLPGPLLFANAPPPTDSRHAHSSADAAAKEWASRTDRFSCVGHKEDPLRFTAASAAHSSGPAVPARTSCRRRPRLRFGGRRRTSAGQRDALVSVRRSADRQGDRRSVRRSRSRDAHRVDERHPLSECPAARVLAACAACPRALCRPAPRPAIHPILLSSFPRHVRRRLPTAAPGIGNAGTRGRCPCTTSRWRAEAAARSSRTRRCSSRR